jgi:hypothetical protein
MKKWVLILLLAMFGLGRAYAQPGLNTEDTHSRLKAIYVYNFATLVDWPKEYKQGNFVIGVFGESKLYTELVDKYSSKTIGSQHIAIKKFTHQSQITDCHILYVTGSNSEKIAELTKKFKDKSTLIVSEKEGLLKSGSIINFIVQGNKQTYELSKTNATKHKLIIGSTLTNLAANVE